MEKAKSLTLLPKYQAPSSWWEHVPIAHWIVERLKPQTIVELGSHYGVSFFSFCEAAESYSPGTYIFAIDTWEGDNQAGFYSNNVYKEVLNNWKNYHSQRSSMLRCRFEDAVDNFEDNSIDIIHIDGLHTYEAVKQDFNNWKSKLRQNGTIMFHDWNVRETGYGVWKLWEEIKKSKEYQCFETPNGYGLAIATLTNEKPKWHEQLEEELAVLVAKGKLLNQIQEQKEMNQALNAKTTELEKHISNMESEKKENEKHISSLIKELNRIKDENEIIKKNSLIYKIKERVRIFGIFRGTG